MAETIKIGDRELKLGILPVRYWRENWEKIEKTSGMVESIDTMIGVVCASAKAAGNEVKPEDLEALSMTELTEAHAKVFVLSGLRRKMPGEAAGP